MSSAVRLPAELREFLSLPGPQSLLVRGPPGSGKTTLSLALLEASAGTRLLLTSRVSRSEIHREFPWVGNNGSNSIDIVDTSDLEVSSRNAMRAAGEQMLIAAEDSKEKQSVVEFLSLPTPIQEAWSRLPERSASTVVLDSWDALVEHHLGALSHHGADGLDRSEIERMMLRRMGRSHAHLIIVVEREDPSQLDYLVNGVVITRREVNHDRLERWLHIPKLRGIRIANATYPYTVEGAKFQCIEPVHAYRQMRTGHFDREPDSVPGFLWPGSTSFAENFGRLPLGKLSLIETENTVPDDVRHNLIAPAMAHSLNRGGRVLLIPPPSLSSQELWNSLEGATTPDRMQEQFRVIDVNGQLEKATRQANSKLIDAVTSVKSVIPSTPDQDPQDSELSRWLRGGVAGGAPNLGVMYSTGLEALAMAMKTPPNLDVAAALPASVQMSLASAPKLHLMAIGRLGGAIFNQIESLAAVHLRVHSRQGRVFIYGLKPWTPGLVITDAADSGPYDLLRIV